MPDLVRERASIPVSEMNDLCVDRPTALADQASAKNQRRNHRDHQFRSDDDRDDLERILALPDRACRSSAVGSFVMLAYIRCSDLGMLRSRHDENGNPLAWQGVESLMVKRLLVIGLIASVLVVTRAGEASACSCVPLQPAAAVEKYDAAFVGILVDRPSSMMPFTEEAPYLFEVEVWVKDDLGSELVVLAPNQGSACGFEAPLGERVGVLLTVEDGKAKGNLCTTVDPDLLLAGDKPLTLDGSGPPVFLIAGYEGAARLMLLDASGGLLATVGAEGEVLNGLALCPGSEFVVELVNDQLIVRSTDDLEEVRRVDLNGLPYRVGVPGIWCRDANGDTLWLATDEWTEQTGTVYRLFDVHNLDQPLVEGEFSWLQVGTDYAVAGEGPTAKRIWRIHLESGERMLLHEIPVDEGDSEPSGNGWVDPTGDRIIITQWRYRDDNGGKTTLLLYDLDTGELIWQSETLPTADGVGWIDDTRFLASSYPDINSDDVDYLVIDTDLFEISHHAQLPGSQRVGDHLVGVIDASLQVMPLAGGEPTELRLLPSETHHLVAVLDADITVTPTTRPTAEPEPAAIAEDAQNVTIPWLAVVAVATILVVLTAAILRRQYSDDPT